MLIILIIEAAVVVVGIILFSIIDVFASFRTVRVFSIIAAVLISAAVIATCIFAITSVDLSLTESILVGVLIAFTLSFWLKLPGSILKER